MPQALPESVAGSGYLRCSGHGTTYGVPLSMVRSVDRPERLEWNAEATGPDAWLPIRSGRIPVFGIGRLLNLTSRRESFGALVQLRGNGESWALGFDSVERFDQQFAEADIRDLPFPIRSEIRSSLRGVVASGGDVVLCLNVDQLAPGQPALRSADTRPVPAPLRSTSLAQPAGQSQILCFGVQGVSTAFGLSGRQVVEFVTTTPHTLVPRAHPSLPAVAIWRDRAVPILDLGLALSLTTVPAKIERLLIAQVSRESGIVAIPTAGIMPRLQDAGGFRVSSGHQGLQPPLVRGVFEDLSGLIAVPDLESILYRTNAG